MVKKKIIALALTLSMLAAFLGACDMLTINRERELNQTVAMVSYTSEKYGVTIYEYVTKRDLLETTINYLNQMAQYGEYFDEKGFNEMMPLIIDALCGDKLVGMYARDWLSEIKGLDHLGTAWEVLTPNEQNQVIKNVNEQYQELFDNYLDQVKAEQDRLKPKDEEKEDEKKPVDNGPISARPAKPEKEDDFEPDASVTELEAKFIYPRNNAQEREASRRLERYLNGAYINYEFMQARAETSMMLYEFRRQLGINKVLDKDINDALDEHLKTVIINNLLSYGLSDAAYAGSLNNGSYMNLLIQPKDGYFFVKNLLISFNANQRALIDLRKEMGWNSMQLEALANSLWEDIRVDISNPDYDPEAELPEELADTEYVVHYKNADTPYTYLDDEDKEVVTTVGEAIANGWFKTAPYQMYSILGVPVQLVLDSFVADMTAAAGDGSVKSLLDSFDKWLYLVNDDPGAFSTNPGYLISPDDSENSWAEQFTEHGRKLFDENGEAGAWRLKDGTYFCITDFGIHIMIISYVPIDMSDVDEVAAGDLNISDYKTIPDDILNRLLSYANGGSTIKTADGYYILSLSQVVDYYADKDGTLGGYLRENLKENLTTTEYTRVRNTLINRHKPEYEINEKIYKNLYKELYGRA